MHRVPVGLGTHFWVPLRSLTTRLCCPCQHHSLTRPDIHNDPKLLMDAETLLRGLTKLHDSHRLPTERFALPITTNMDYGFYTTDKVRGA